MDGIQPLHKIIQHNREVSHTRIIKQRKRRTPP